MHNNVTTCTHTYTVTVTHAYCLSPGDKHSVAHAQEDVSGDGLFENEFCLN